MIANIFMCTVIPKREALKGGWRNSRKEIFHFVYVHRMLSRMTKSRRELVWNVARMWKFGNTHRMLSDIKRIFTYNLDERRSSKITCTVSLHEMASLGCYLPSGSSRYTISTRSDWILHWVSKMYKAPVRVAVAMHLCTIHMLKRDVARVCHLKFKRKFPDSPVPHGKTVYKLVKRPPARGSVLGSRRTGIG